MDNPFSERYEVCNTGDPKEKLENLSDYPGIIDLELTNSCNFRCLMCPTGNLSQTRKTGFMSKKTFYRILAEAAEHNIALRFIGWGEPTLHPDCAEFVTAAVRAGVLTHLNTNGSKEDVLHHCVEGGLASLKFSFQGVDRKSYEEMRNVDYFNELQGVIYRTFNLANDTFVQISTTTTYETPEDIEEFKHTFENYCDSLTIGKTTFDFMDMKAVRLKPEDKARLEKLISLESLDKKHPVPCPEVFDKLSIAWNGQVKVCCNDYDNVTDCGNINDNPIESIWSGIGWSLGLYRKTLARKDYSLPLCVDCYDYSCLTKG